MSLEKTRRFESVSGRDGITLWAVVSSCLILFHSHFPSAVSIALLGAGCKALLGFYQLLMFRFFRGGV